MMFSSEIDNNDEMPKVTVTAFIEEELKDGLKDLADYERRSMSQMIAVLIERAVNKAREEGTIPNPASPSKD